MSTNLLPSGKTADQKYDLKATDPNKVFTRLDARQLATDLQFLAEVARGFAYSGNEGNAAALDNDLSIINTSNLTTYAHDLTKSIQTLVSFRNTMEVDAVNSTANNIILLDRKIIDEVSPNGNNYCRVSPTPFKWAEDLTFEFRAIAANTDAMTLQIPSLAGLSGSIDIVDESGAALTGGEMFIGKYVQLKLRTISSVKRAVLIKPTIVNASETNRGIIEIATQAESNAGTDDLKVITPLKLKVRQGVRYVGRLTASSTTTLGQSLSTGKKYIFRLNNLVPSANPSYLTAQVSTNNGATLISSGYVNISLWHTNATAAGGYNNKTSGLTLTGVDADANTGCGNEAVRGGVNGWFILDDPSQTSSFKQANWRTSFYDNTSRNYFTNQIGCGAYEVSSTVINYIGFTFKQANSNTNSGVITSGSIDVWEVNE